MAQVYFNSSQSLWHHQELAQSSQDLKEMEIASVYGTPPPENVKIPSGSFLSLFPPGQRFLVTPFLLR